MLYDNFFNNDENNNEIEIDFSQKEKAYKDMNQFFYDSSIFMSALCEIYEINATEETISPDEDIQKLYEHIKGRLDKSKKIAFMEISDRFSLNEFEKFTFLICLMFEYDDRYAFLCAKILGKESPVSPNLSIVSKMFMAIRMPTDEEKYGLFDSENRKSSLLLEHTSEDEFLPRPLCFFRIEQQIFMYCVGKKNFLPESLKYYCHLGEKKSDSVIAHEDEIIKISKVMEKDTFYIHVYGDKGNGRHFMINKAAEIAERKLFFVDYSSFSSKNKNDDRVAKQIALFSVINNCIPCIVNDKQSDNLSDNESFEFFVKKLVNLISRCIIITQKPFGPLVWCDNYLQINCVMPDSSKQKEFWKFFEKKYNCDMEGLKEAELAGIYKLSPGKIEALIKDVSLSKTINSLKEKSVSELITRSLTEDAIIKLSSSASFIRPSFDFEDLILNDNQKELLSFIIEVAKLRYKVNEEMGFERKLPYGKGISILLYGPPGTGKTMTAQVLSKEIGLGLFKVDTSKIIDKYIGETSKKMGALFDIAADTNSILFFDEADAFFAKRTEVNDSNSKHANADTAYLLQRMEQHDGITILATNNFGNFDSAFRRRITYYINIDKPDEATRKKLWERVFPEEIKIDSSVNFDELAKKFDFSGSSIKFVAMEATYAAAINDGCVDRKCIRKGLELEYAKEGKILQIIDYPA